MKHFYSSRMKLFVSILVFQFVIISSNAQWSTNPAVNNAICTAPDIQRGQIYNQFTTMVSDGSGGAIITWNDYRSGGLATSDIYAQRIDANGIVKWTTDGVPICTAGSSQRDPVIASDGNGGAIITWWDSRIANIDIYAQRINANGVVQWTPDGVRISTATTVQQYPNIVSDGSNGAIITWEDYNIYSGLSDIYAQRINGNGVAQWTANGVVISATDNTKQSPTIIMDGSGGAIISWRDGRTIAPGFYTQRINASGATQWTADGVAVTTAASPVNNASITSDGNGGAIFAWQDSRSGLDIYAQYINGSGAFQWAINGVAISTAANNQQTQDIVSDGSGGAIITWSDSRSASSSDVYAQRINSGGVVQWTADGVVISATTSHQDSPTLISDAIGGAIITWRDNRTGLYDVYAQRINSSGVVQWTTNGVAISTATGLQEFPIIVSDGNGGAIFTWRDSRNGVSNYDVFAQQVGANGVLGNIATGIKNLSESIQGINLVQNYPNPFQQSTKIRYETGSRRILILKVYDLLGNEIKTLVNEEKPAGTYDVDFDGASIASGTYIIKLQSGLLSETRKMILMK
jgi:hypothetical protein